MKKIYFLLMLLIGIGLNASMVDGVYYAEKISDNNWKSFGKIIVKGNRIIGIQYDKKDSMGNLLSLNQSENEIYKSNFGESFRDTSFKLTRNLVSVQDVNKMLEIKDQKSYEEFKEIMKFLIEKANEGKSGEYKIH